MSEQSHHEPDPASAPPVADDGRVATGGTGSSDGLPGWAPWAVLGALLSFGLLGGLGSVPLSGGLKSTAAATAAPALPSSVAKLASSAAPGASAHEQWYSAIYLVVSHKDTKLGAVHKITRTREEAKQRVEMALGRARKGENFAKLVQEFSDEPTLEKTHGVLESFRFNDAVRPFADAVAAIKPGEVSGVVETQFGFHVIKRLEPRAPSPSSSASAASPR